MTPEALANQWLDLFNTNVGKAITNMEFRGRYNEIDTKYKALSDEDKAKFTAIVHQGVRHTLAVKPWRADEPTVAMVAEPRRT